MTFPTISEPYYSRYIFSVEMCNIKLLKTFSIKLIIFGLNLTEIEIVFGILSNKILNRIRCQIRGISPPEKLLMDL